MPDPDHRLERRAQLLATKIGERVSTVRDAVAAPGSRPPFTAAPPRAEVLDWWRTNIDTEFGKQALARLKPQDVVDLHVALARHIEADPVYPPEEMGAGIDEGSLPPPGTTPMPPQVPAMGPPPMTQPPPPPTVPIGSQPPFAQ